MAQAMHSDQTSVENQIDFDRNPSYNRPGTDGLNIPIEKLTGEINGEIESPQLIKAEKKSIVFKKA